MTKHRSHFAILLLLPMIIFSCATLGGLGKNLFQQPVVTLDSIAISGMDFQQVSLLANLDVYNPNPYSVPIKELRYSLFLDNSSTNTALVTGTARSETALKALATNAVAIPFSIPFETLLNSPMIVSNKIYYTVKGEALVKGFESFPIPFSYTGSFPLPKMPQFTVKSFRMTGFSPLQLKSSLAVVVGVENPNDFRLEMNDVKLRMDLLGKPLINRTNNAPVRIPSNGSQDLELSFELDFTPIKDLMAALMKSTRINVRFSGSFTTGTGAGKPITFEKTTEIKVEK